MALDEAIIGRLVGIVGEGQVVTDREMMDDYAGDEYALEEIRRLPDAVVRPASTDQVSAVARLCSERSIPLTPRGAGTGLCGGCVPAQGGIVLTFERMNRVVEIDRENLMATVQAGVPLMEFYEAVEKEGFFFPPHPGDESATMGGVIATNAGGARALKYGIVRNFVRGIEVVFADGRTATIGGKLMKNSSGYSLLHLIIGSEGTLGIVTGAYINLMAPPKVMQTLIVPYTDLHAAIRTVPRIIQQKILPLSVEFVEIEAIRICEQALDKSWPFQEGEAHLMIIIDAPDEERIMEQAEAIGEVCLEEGAIDVFVADSREKQATILEIRSHLYEALKPHTLELLDITVPRAEIAGFVSDVHDLEEELETWIPTYGHAADGNVHNHLMRAAWRDGGWEEIPGWKEKYPRVRDRIHQLGGRYGGIVSGEHGIGLAKKPYLADSVGREQVELMRGIKAVFDPKGILNPGKIF